MSDLLLQTKFFKPALRPSLINRRHLIDRLNSGLNQSTESFAARLTLVSAPAGFGKTTLVSSWLAGLAGVKSAWYSLDENDNDPVRFLTYFIAALQTAEPGIGESAVGLLQSPQPQATETTLTLLINEVSQNGRPLLLVLDDYHLIEEPVIHRLLAFLLDNMPPSLHLLITTRSDPPLPLPRWRVRQQVIELRAADLRFTKAEAGLFLNQAIGLNLSHEELAALDERTEGWIAGLQLAALSLEGKTDFAGFIQSFTGSHVFVLDYLADEVLQQKPPDVLQFLQETAVLDQLNGSLCNALTGRADSHALLRQLYKSNLFLQALDDNLEWFRFHALFREVLLMQLRKSQTDRIPLLHRRACQWFTQAGQITTALQHAFAAGDMSLAASLIEQHAEKYISLGEYFTVRSWLDQLPQEFHHTHPRIILIDGTILTVTGSLNQAEQLLEETAERFQDLNLPDEIRGERALLQTTLYRFQGHLKEAIESGQQALRLIPAHRHTIRNSVLSNLIICQFMLGDISATESLFSEIKDDDTDASLTLAFSLPYLHYIRGELSQAVEGFKHLLDKASNLGKSPVIASTLAYAGLGDIAYERNNLPEALDYLTPALSNLKNSIEQITIVRTAGKLALARLAIGEKSAVFDSLDEISGWLEHMRLADLGFGIVLAYHRAALYLQLGDVDSAVLAVANHKLPPLTIGRAEEYLIHTKLLLAQGRTGEAVDLLDKIDQEAEKRKWIRMQIEANSQRALAFAQLGDSSAAFSNLSSILPFAEREGYRRVFLDKGQAMHHLIVAAHRQGISPHYLELLLSEFPVEAQSSPISAAMPDPLTGREMELLGWVATGASNKEIAAELFISLSTVKKHMSNILVKLDAANRTEAISNARELGLI